MKFSSSTAFRLAGAAALACAGTLAGCGWTARDEYLLNARGSISARAGDGSFLSSEWKADRERQLHAAEVAARFEEPK